MPILCIHILIEYIFYTIVIFNYSFHLRERREAEQRERQEKERRERIERDRMERERREREREQQQKLSAVEAVDHHFQLSMELAKKVNKMKNIKKIFCGISSFKCLLNKKSTPI